MAWQVWRIDDHGNQFLVATHSTEEAAKAHIAKLTEGVHKQHYWIVEIKTNSIKPVKDLNKRVM